MSAIQSPPERPETELAARAICPRVGYYVKITPRPVGQYFWAGPYPDHLSANEARRKDYRWPRFETADPWYFIEGDRVS